MLIIKGDTVLDVTPKAYEIIYREHDFTIQAEPEVPKETPAKPIKPKTPAKKTKAKAGEE